MTAKTPDLLLRLASHKRGASLLRRFGLPTPVALERIDGGWREKELAGHQLAVAGLGESTDLLSLTAGLQGLGAVLDETGNAKLDAILLDARQMASQAELVHLHELFALWLPQLSLRARIVVLGPAALPGQDPALHATAQALAGFVRSLGKEIGRRAAGINLLTVPEASSPALLPAVSFLLSRRSGFISGQQLDLSAVRQEADAPTLPLLFPWAPKALEGQLAVVTGAARGIGAATATRLVEEGARVLCVDMPAQAAALQALAERLGGTALTLDITAADAGQQLVDAVQALGGVDVMVHNAGITRDRTLARMPAADFQAVINVNLAAVIALDDALDEAGAWREGARSLCLSSINGIGGAAGQTNYAAAKAGLIGYVRGRARQLAGSGAVINAVAPGFIETDMTARLPWSIAQAGRRLSSLSQGGLPRDVAEAITFLALPQHGGINGQVLRVCGQSFVGA